MTRRSRAPQLLLALATLALGLSACVSKGQDKRYSVYPSQARACALMPDGEPMKLEPGQSCVAHVVASQPISRTPLRVDRCETYVVTVPPGQYWHDQGRVSRPPHGEDGSFFMNLAKGYKRVPQAKWFALIGTAVDVKEASVSHFDQDISHRPVLSIDRPGRLGFYPNDALLPGTGNLFYDNNGGEIWVQVTRTENTCP